MQQLQKQHWIRINIYELLIQSLSSYKYPQLDYYSYGLLTYKHKHNIPNINDATSENVWFF